MTAIPKPTRAKLKGKELRRLQSAVIRRDKNRCGICECWPPPGNHFPLHHIVYPRGADTLDNLISVCQRCHNDAHNHIILGKRLGSKEAVREWLKGRVKSLLEDAFIEQ